MEDLKQAIRQKLKEAGRAKRREREAKEEAIRFAEEKTRLVQEAVELRNQLPSHRVVSAADLFASGRWDAEYHLYGDLADISTANFKEEPDD